MFLTIFGLYLNETVGGRFREISNSLVLIFYGTGGVAVNILSVWWSFYRFYFGLLTVLALASLLGMAFIPKTPFFLYFKRDFDLMAEVLAKMARVNGISDWGTLVQPDLLVQVEEAKARHRRVSIKNADKVEEALK